MEDRLPSGRAAPWVKSKNPPALHGQAFAQLVEATQLHQRTQAQDEKQDEILDARLDGHYRGLSGLAPIFPYTFYHLTHDWFVAADIPVANDTPVHYADAIRCNVRRPPQGSLPLLTRRVSA